VVLSKILNSNHCAEALAPEPLVSSVSTAPLTVATGGLDIAAFLYTTSELPVFIAA